MHTSRFQNESTITEAISVVSDQSDLPSSDFKTHVINIANLLTLFRLALVPVFLSVFFLHGGHDEHNRIFAGVIFAIAASTDRLDGMLARSLGLVTDFGALVDPIVDKLLMGSALVSLSWVGDLWPWVTGVILFREIGITVLRLIVLPQGVIPASRGGKAKTMAQSIGIGLFILPLHGLWLEIAWVIMAIAVILTVVTGVDYLRGVLARPHLTNSTTMMEN